MRRIVDMTAGNRAIWFNKNHPGTVYLDLRPGTNPTFVVDSRDSKLADNHFDLVVFDPPHCAFGPKSTMAKSYGVWTTKQIRELLAGAAKEAYRISRPDALMAFKWNDHDFKFESALKLMQDYWLPLFGHHVSARKATRASTTYWALLHRKQPGSTEGE